MLELLFEHLDPAWPEGTYICNFHLHQQIDFRIEPVWAGLLPWNQETWLTTLSGKAVTAAVYRRSQRFYFLLPPLLPLYKVCKLPPLRLCSLACTKLKFPLSFSYLASFTAPVKAQKPFLAALTLLQTSPTSTPPVDTPFVLFTCQFICPQILSPDTFRSRILKFLHRSPRF